jgi:hypothetical protein
LDRLLSGSRYFRTTNQSNTTYFKGYIYSVDSSGNLSSEQNTLTLNSGSAKSFTVGAPYHFYFGLRRGKSAYDKFGREWLKMDSEDL